MGSNIEPKTFPFWNRLFDLQALSDYRDKLMPVGVIEDRKPLSICILQPNTILGGNFNSIPVAPSPGTNSSAADDNYLQQGNLYIM